MLLWTRSKIASNFGSIKKRGGSTEADEVACRQAQIRDMFRPLPGLIESAWYRNTRERHVKDILSQYPGLTFTDAEFKRLRYDLTIIHHHAIFQTDSRWIGLQPLTNMVLTDSDKKSIEKEVEDYRRQLVRTLSARGLTPVTATRALMIFFTQSVEKHRLTRKYLVPENVCLITPSLQTPLTPITDLIQNSLQPLMTNNNWTGAAAGGGYFRSKTSKKIIN